MFCLFPLDLLVLYFEQNNSVIVICGEHKDHHGHIHSGSSNAQDSTIVSSNRKTHKLVCALSMSLLAYVMSSIQSTVHYYNKLCCLWPYTTTLWEGHWWACHLSKYWGPYFCSSTSTSALTSWSTQDTPGHSHSLAQVPLIPTMNSISWHWANMVFLIHCGHYLVLSCPLSMHIRSQHWACCTL